MKKTYNYLVLLFFISINALISCSLGPLTGFLKIDVVEDSNSFANMLEKQKAVLSEDKNKFEDHLRITKSRVQAATNESGALKEKTKSAVGLEREFFQQKLLIVNQSYQVLTEIEQVLQRIITLVESHIKLLQEYKQDPEFKSKNLKVPIKSLYLFSDLQKINDRMVQYDTELKELEEKAKKITDDVSNRQKIQSIARQEYAEKKKQQAEFSVQASRSTDDVLAGDSFTIQQRGELLDEEEKLFGYKRELADAYLRESEEKRNILVDFQIKTTRLQLQILKDEYERVKRLFQVDEQYKTHVENELERERQESTARQKKYKESIEGLDVVTKYSLNEELITYKQQFSLSDSDINNIAQWTMQPQSLVGWNALLTVHKLLQKIALATISKEQLEAQIELERTKIRQQEVITLIVNTWYKLTTHKDELITVDALTKEIKRYETLKADIQAIDTSMSEKRTLATNNLNANSKIFEHIKARVKEFKEQKETTFKGHLNDYNQYFARLKDAEDDIRARGEPLARIIELYAQIHDIRLTTLQKIEGILHELRTRAQSIGSQGAILKGLQDLVPDINKFVKDTSTLVYSYYSRMHVPTLDTIMHYYIGSMYEFFSLLLQAFIVLLIFMLIKLYVPDVIKFTALVGPEYGIAHSISNFLGLVLRFMSNNLIPLFFWLVASGALRYGVIKEPVLRIVFYFASIPFLLYYAYKFINYIKRINRKLDYALLSKSYQKRFLIVLGFLLYSTIIILCLREAFIQISYHKSQVPTTLLALNFIIFQLSLVCLLGRDQILSIVPRTTNVWQWIYDGINRYYYLFLTIAIFVILMSNPYVGYGPQFFNIVSRIILIFLLVPLFSVLHNQIKRSSIALFFYNDGETLKERFSYAKTTYGFFVIFSFLFFAALGLVIALNIWGYSTGLNDISNLLHRELYPAGIDEAGRPIIITPLSFIKVIGFVLAGALIAYSVNRFILQRIFDLLLVNIGIQNALFTLTRYAIILASFVIGLQTVGLGSALLYIFAVIGGLGVAAKELITDFIAYFIILVQRPIKIGDFIMFDEDTRGVVRHITLRSVILRRKNSVTVIIPNSQVMTRPVVNWNYSRTFFAFDDIILTVSYNADPGKVKELIAKVLESNFNVLKNPSPIIQLSNFVDNGFQFMIRGFLSPDKVLEQFDIASDIRLELVRILRSNAIDVASPTRIVKVVSGVSSEFGSLPSS